VERFCGPSTGRGGGEKLWKNCRQILRALLRKIFLQFFHNFSPPPLPVEGLQNLSTILPQFFHNSSSFHSCVEEFGASGLAWRRIVEGIIVEKSWKHLVNAAPGIFRRKTVRRQLLKPDFLKTVVKRRKKSLSCSRDHRWRLER
jgi:hypothetical protein